MKGIINIDEWKSLNIKLENIINPNTIIKYNDIEVLVDLICLNPNQFKQNDIDRFWSKVIFKYRDGYIDLNECMIWDAFIHKQGYGRFGLKIAHRYSYELFNADYDSKLLICHACDEPTCVNPFHLWQGTNLDNSNDKIKKKRHSYGSKNVNAKITESDLFIILDQIRSGSIQSCQQIMDEYDLHGETVYKIFRGGAWTIAIDDYCSHNKLLRSDLDLIFKTFLGPTSKPRLTDDQVREIKLILKSGNFNTFQEIGDKYNVSRIAISNINTGRSYCDVII